MKNLIPLLMIAALGWSPANAQKGKTQQQLHVKIEMDDNGKEIKIDTVFNSKKDADAYLKSKGMNPPSAPPMPPKPPMPPMPSMAKMAIPPAPPIPTKKKLKGRKNIATNLNGMDGESYNYSYQITKDLDSVRNERDRSMVFSMPSIDQELVFSDDVPEKEILISQFNTEEKYPVDFEMSELGTAKITIQGSDGKMLYEETLEGVKGNFSRSFDKKKYAGATLELYVQSGKSKQSRKLIL